MRLLMLLLLGAAAADGDDAGNGCVESLAVDKKDVQKMGLVHQSSPDSRKILLTDLVLCCVRNASAKPLNSFMFQL